VPDFDAFERAGWSAGRAAPYHHGLGAITARPVPAEVQASVRRLYGEALERSRVDGGYEVPCAAKLGAATRS
jgi:hypothetical protein